MHSFQALSLRLVCALAALWLAGFYADAQQFLTPATNADHFGNLSQSVDFVWTYSTPDISKTSLYCQVNRQNIVFKRAAAGATAEIKGPFIGRADAIDITSSQPFRFGFKLKNLAFTDANTYACFLTYEGDAPVSSNVYYFKIYEPPRAVDCLTDGLQVDNNGNRYFSVREGGVLNSTCYVYGNPVPTLICRTYDIENKPLVTLSSNPPTINFTSYPPDKRMLFSNVRKAVVKVICVADGQAAGRLSIEQSVRVDYLPSVPRNIKLVKSTPDSIRISWEAPQEPGLSRITDYYMELVHPNGTITVTNHTIILSVTPILDYTFTRLYANLEYSIRVAAYNAIGMGARSPTVKYKTVFYDSAAGARTSSGLSTGSIVGIVFGVLIALVLILIIVFFVMKKRKEKARYPQTYVEEAVDYPSAGGGMYAHVNKNKFNSGANDSTSGYPDIIHKAKPEDEKPMMQSGSQSNDERQTSAYEKSRKEYV